MRKPRIVAWGNSSGSALWRLKDPLFVLNKTGVFECRTTSEAISKEILEWGDIFVTQSIVDKNGIALMYEYQQEHGKKLVVEQDDYFTVEKDNPYKLHHDLSNAAEVIKITMEIADMVTVSTPYLGEQLKEYNKHIKVLPNYMLMDRWDSAYFISGAVSIVDSINKKTHKMRLAGNLPDPTTIFYHRIDL